MNLSDLDAGTLRQALPAFLASYIDDPAAAAANAGRIAALVADWEDADFDAVKAHLADLGSDMRVYDALPKMRELSRIWCRDVVTEGVVTGLEHVRAARAAGPTVVIGNHLTYFDTTATDAALAWAGAEDVADALVTAAGPKVYETLFRRFASGCLGTLAVPQSNTVGAEELSPRELARRAIASLKASKDAMLAGQSLQIYPEGTRSRDGRFGPFLKAIYRYLAVPGARVVPMALVGTEQIMPVGKERLTPGPITVTYGPAIEVHDAKEALEAAWHGVAALLPPELAPSADTAPLR